MRFWLTCASCGADQPFALSKSVCTCGGTLLVTYDLERITASLTKLSLREREATMWRYAELLPVQHWGSFVSLGEGWTPLIRLNHAEARLPLKELWVKREEQNPTGSFKARGFSVAISIAKEHGIRKVAVNSNGNAASAMAAYAGRAGMEAYVFLPRDVPGLIAQECVSYGASTWLVDGLIHDAGKVIQDGVHEQGWYPLGTLKEPGRAEGKKTMGLELAEQFQWRLPDVIIYPTGGGSGIVGMWRAFQQLKEMGWIEGELPRFVSVQEQGCEPIVQAMVQRTEFASIEEGREVNSGPTGLRVPHPPDGKLLLSILRASSGTAVAVSQEEMKLAQLALGKQGVSASPEGAATWAGLLRLIEHGYIREKDRVVLFNTCHAMKYWPWHTQHLPVISSYKDWVKLQAGGEPRIS